MVFQASTMTLLSDAIAFLPPVARRFIPPQGFANRPLSSAYAALLAKPSKRPSASSRAARRNPPHAAPAKALPTLTRRTPSLARSASVKFPGEPISTFTGLGATACTIAVICSGERAPGAYRQSAPACAYAFNRFTDSFNASECPARKHSARPISITSSTEASIASRAARMRATASSNSYTGCDAAAHVLFQTLDVARVAVLEIGVDRQIGRFDDFAAVRQHRVQIHRVVGTPARPGETGAGGRQRLEAQLLQQPRGTRIP